MTRQPCRDCGRSLPSHRHAGRPRLRCTACVQRWNRERRRERNRARDVARARERRGNPDAFYLTAGDPGQRQRADRALNRGRCDRRCLTCGTRYHLTRLTTPCPRCGDHLQDNPLENVA